ncbi:MAG: DMT family protein [Lysobacteraceae bacterium]
MPAPLHAYLVPILLLIGSNIFMTFAWYGHLKFKTVPLLTVILVCWLIALPEYLLQVPANRMGHAVYSAVQLKTIQVIITLSVFVVFSITYLGEAVRWNHLAGFALIVVAAFLIFMD